MAATIEAVNEERTALAHMLTEAGVPLLHHSHFAVEAVGWSGSPRWNATDMAEDFVVLGYDSIEDCVARGITVERAGHPEFPTFIVHAVAERP